MALGTMPLFISWFLHQTTTHHIFERLRICCLSLDSYIKPQRQPIKHHQRPVVYLLIPTSNHNGEAIAAAGLNVVYLLIPTSNHNLLRPSLISVLLFISWFLHQTTTTGEYEIRFRSCLSLDSYIKPQLPIAQVPTLKVVYLLIPTSNHNFALHVNYNALLFISWFLHQTTTRTKTKHRRHVVYLLIPTSNHNAIC